MGKPTGFIEWPRVTASTRSASERIHDFREFSLPLLPEERTRQAGRCMDCGVPTCHQGCPLGNVIPDFNEHVYAGRWREAYLTLASTNNFPEWTGRLCPAPCEAACVLAIDGAPVTIEQLEKEIIERAFAEGWVVPRPPRARSGKRVAIVGSGPAGLAAAAQLNQAGHSVTVYERSDSLGGLLRYGIPSFKLERTIVDRRLRVLEAEGIVFRTGVDVGGELGWRALAESTDALVLAIGAGKARTLDVPGGDLPGVLPAMHFLSATQRGEPIAGVRGDVVILGGGDTGSDCLGTAHRLGARSVRQIELLPAPPATRTSANPWPQWPLVFRTSSSQQEGGARDFALSTTRIEGKDGRVARLHAIEVAIEAGRLVPRAGTEQVLDVELLVLALGFTGPDLGTLRAELPIELDARGAIAVDEHFATSVPKVFCAGDASRGASLIVWAISDGREAARGVDAFLSGQPSRLPTRGRDTPFGGR